MNYEVEAAAIISAGAGVLTLIRALAAQMFGRRATKRIAILAAPDELGAGGHAATLPRQRLEPYRENATVSDFFDAYSARNETSIRS